jgi:hypothetical protein
MFTIIAAGIVGFVLGIIADHMVGEAVDKQNKAVETSNQLPTLEAFEEYWRLNPERIVVRFSDSGTVRCIVYKNLAPWFCIDGERGILKPSFAPPAYYLEDRVWDTKELSKDKKPDQHPADKYLNTMALSILAQVNEVKTLDAAKQSAYKEIDDFVKGGL